MSNLVFALASWKSSCARLTTTGMLTLTLLLPLLAQAQAVGIGGEYQKKIKAAEEVTPLGGGAFGNHTSDATGKTVFETIDIDLPGNDRLPVQLGRRLAIDERFVIEELGGFGNWDVDVPYIQGTFSKSLGWSVAAVNSSNQYKRCSIATPPIVEGLVFTSEEVSHGYSIHVPGVLDDTLMQDANGYSDPTDGVSYPWILSSMARLSCLPTVKNGYPGEGFALKLTDGTKYFFDYPVERVAPTLRKAAKFVPGYSMERKRIFLLATRIEDRFGNYVTYQYTGDRLTGITSSDGRHISLTHNASSITATADARTWLYTLQNGHLTSVQNPDGSKWTYTPFGNTGIRYDYPGDGLGLDQFLPENFCLNPDLAASPYQGTFTFTATHPSGATANFTFEGNHFYRSYVRYLCTVDFFDHKVKIISGLNLISNYGDWASVLGDVLDQQFPDGSTTTADVSGVAHIMQPNYFGVYSLKTSTISGPGVAPQTTAYNYLIEPYPYCDQISSISGEYEGLRCNQNPCPSADCVDGIGRWTEITLPTGEKVRKRHGVVFGRNEGLLLEEQVVASSGTALQTTTNQYFDGASSPNRGFNPRIGWAFTPDPMQGNQTPLIARQTLQQGANFNHVVTAFDAFARPVTVDKWSGGMAANFGRTDVTEYHDNLNKWVLGQVSKVTNANTNVVLSQVDYDPPSALPVREYGPGTTTLQGNLQRTMTYYGDGNLATVKDGNNNVTTLSDWYRGIPRTIQYPGTPEAPSGATQTAVVNDNGWITAMTDENGFSTGYGYDAMGRLASIVYPTGDSTAWNTTTQNFIQINSDEHGLAPGHWRSSRAMGNGYLNVYYDAMWRPVLEEKLDLGNIGGTVSQVVKRYDVGGRLDFQSYPANNVTDFQAITQGVRTFYDALDRVTRVEQDSELGVLASTTVYQNGFQTLSTNPRGLQVTTEYQAYDQPTTDFPVGITTSADTATEIHRDVFYKPTLLVRRNHANTQRVERRYVYDGHQQLCKTIEPETGATVMDYDSAGNLQWSAAGTALTSTSSCDTIAGRDSGRKVTRYYDARNRLTNLEFPDGRGNQVWSYSPDGLPASITTYNEAGSTVVNTYTYNKRRMLTHENTAQPGWYGWGIGYGYDGNGSLAVQYYPTGLAIAYAPNALGQPTQVSDQSTYAYATGVQYYPNGAIKQFTYGNGIVHTMLQNARQLPQRSTDSGGALDLAYSFDANANVNHIWDYAQDSGNGFYGRWMTYDSLDRLTDAGSCSFGGDCWHRFTYDALDNLKSWKLPGVKDYAEYVYTNNRLTNIKNTAGATVVGLDYDVQGNLSNKNGQAYLFDYGNRLRDVPSKESYRYDGPGRRVLNWRPADNTTTLSQYSQSGQVLYNENTKTLLKTEHIYLGGSLLANRETIWATGAVTAKYQHTDALGSPVAVTNMAGAVIDRTNYEPYGAAINKPAYDGIGYTGHVMDGATGLSYMQQRYYDPTIGRFLSTDPITTNGTTGANFNRYKYASNNPYRFTDPDGRHDKELAAYRREEIQKQLEADNEWTYQPASGAIEPFTLLEETFIAPIRLTKQGQNYARFVPQGRIPNKARNVEAYARATGRAPAGYASRRYANDGRDKTMVLPKKDAEGREISYREYDVNKLDKDINRGTERVVVGSDGKSWYTNDHYKTFVEMKEKK